jgi:hypothetical protein
MGKHRGANGLGNKRARPLQTVKFVDQLNSEDWTIKDRIEDRDRIAVEDVCIDDADRALSPIGRFFRHNATHERTTRMVLDEFGRCAKCVKLGFWKPDA